MTDVDEQLPFFDISDPGFSLRSAPVWQARAGSWYARTNYGIAVLRYDEVRALVRDRRLRQGTYAWPRQNGVTSGSFHEFSATQLINLEGADHARLRRLLSPAFSRRLITSLVPRFQALASELVDAFHGEGKCEFVSQFAEPYAGRVISILLGLPEREWKRIADFSHSVGLASTVRIREELPRIESALAGLCEYADAVIAARRAQPEDDFVTSLIAANADKDSLSDTELRNSVVGMIMAGIDTTRDQLGLAMATFLRNPAQWELLAQRELGDAAVEEVMRVAPTVTWVTREALQDFEFQGVPIKAGTALFLLTESSGTDPAAVGDAGFDIAADRPPHFGFGGGAHHCLGHLVARCDMSAALPLLARRLGSPREDGEAQWKPVSGNTGPARLPIRFTPR